jgi:hypothetical protein
MERALEDAVKRRSSGNVLRMALPFPHLLNGSTSPPVTITIAWTFYPFLFLKN